LFACAWRESVNIPYSIAHAIFTPPAGRESNNEQRLGTRAEADHECQGTKEENRVALLELSVPESLTIILTSNPILMSHP